MNALSMLSTSKSAFQAEIDQLRSEACSLQFFSNDQFRIAAIKFADLDFLGHDDTPFDHEVLPVAPTADREAENASHEQDPGRRAHPRRQRQGRFGALVQVG